MSNIKKIVNHDAKLSPYERYIVKCLFEK